MLPTTSEPRNLTPHIPRVSVIMSARNAGPYVREAVQSILSQSFTDFDFLIVDDGSTDETLSTLQYFAAQDSRIKVLPQERFGIPRSLNRGIELSHGTYMCRQDADDISHPSRLATQLQFLDIHAEIAAVGSVGEVVDASGSLIRLLEVPLDHVQIRKRLPSEICFLHGSLLIRREAFEVIGRYRPQFPLSSDYDLYLRLSERFKVANLPQALYQYRAQTDRVSMRYRDLQQLYHDIALDLARQRAEDGTDMLGARSLPRR